MEEMGLRIQAVSPMPELYSYWLPSAPAAELIAHINEQIGEMVAASDRRLVRLGAVPLQDLDRAIAELQRTRRDLGFAGSKLAAMSTADR